MPGFPFGARVDCSTARDVASRHNHAYCIIAIVMARLPESSSACEALFVSEVLDWEWTLQRSCTFSAECGGFRRSGAALRVKVRCRQ